MCEAFFYLKISVSEQMLYVNRFTFLHTHIVTCLRLVGSSWHMLVECSIFAKVEYFFSLVCLYLALHTPTIFSPGGALGMQQKSVIMIAQCMCATANASWIGST